MGSPAYNIDELEFDDPNDPELAELLDLPDAVVDTPDGGAANDNADSFGFDPVQEGEPAASEADELKAKLAYAADEGDGNLSLDPANDNALPAFLTYQAPTDAPEPPKDTRSLREQAYAFQPREVKPPAPPSKPGQMSYGEAMAIGERNPFEMGGEAQGFGRRVAAAMQEPIPRTAGRGMDAPPDTRTEYEIGKDIADEEGERALEQQPGAYRTGQALTETIALAPSMMVAPLAAGGRLALTGGSAAARMAAPTVGEAVGANMAQAFPVGALTGAGASEGETPLEVAEDAATGGNVAAIGAGGLTGAVGAAARGAPALAEKAGKAADRWRAAATGMFGDEADKLTRMYGPEYLQSLGQHIERLGLHKKPSGAVGPLAMPIGGGLAGAGYGAYTSDDPSAEGRALNALKYGAGGALAGTLIGRVATPATYGANARRVTERVGAELGDVIDEATAQGVSFPKAELIQRMRVVLRGYSPNTPEGQAMRERVRGLIETVRDKFADNITPSQLQRLKRSYLAPETGGFEPTRNTPKTDANVAQMYRKAARVPKNAIKESIEEQGLREPRADVMSTPGKFGQLTEDYRAAKTAENAANRRMGREAGNQPISLLSASTGSVPGAIAAEITKRGGRDIGADVLRGVQRAAEGSQVAKSILRAAPGSSPAARVERAVGETTMDAMGAALPAHAQENQKPQDLTTRLREIAKTDPQQLGEWGPFLAASKTTDEFNVRHSTLMARDTKYRERIRRIAQQKQRADEGQPLEQEAEQ